MAEQDLDLSQISSEKTAASSDSKLGNIIGILQGQNTITDEVKEETKKTRSDLGKQHNWKKTADKEESKKSALIAASLNMIKSSSKYMSGILKGMDLRALRAMKDAMKEKMGAGWAGIKSVASNQFASRSNRAVQAGLKKVSGNILGSALGSTSPSTAASLSNFSLGFADSGPFSTKMLSFPSDVATDPRQGHYINFSIYKA